MTEQSRRHIEVMESSGIPPLDVPFAFGPMLPFVLGAIAARRGEAPLYFGRLRRIKIPIALIDVCPRARCATLTRTVLGLMPSSMEQGLVLRVVQFVLGWWREIGA
jgi:hypothetical protein